LSMTQNLGPQAACLLKLEEAKRLLEGEESFSPFLGEGPMSRLHSGELAEMWAQLRPAVEHFFRQAASADTEKSEQEEGLWAAVPT
jgi:hypothetical protein